MGARKPPMMTGFQAEENLTGRAPKKCAKNSGRYPRNSGKLLRNLLKKSKGILTRNTGSIQRNDGILSTGILSPQTDEELRNSSWPLALWTENLSIII